MSIFRAAISPRDETVDPGYLALFWALVGWSVAGSMVIVMAMIAISKASPADAGALIQNVGISLGAISTGFAAVVGSVGLFRAGDKERPTKGAQT